MRPCSHEALVIGDIKYEKEAHGVSEEKKQDIIHINLLGRYIFFWKKLTRTILNKIWPEESGGKTAKPLLSSCVPQLKLEGKWLKEQFQEKVLKSF